VEASRGALGGRDSLRIVVLGYVVRGPMGGMAWHHLQYVLGLHRLGHDVWFLEDSDDYPSCYDPSVNQMGEDPTYGLAFAGDAFDRLGLAERWSYYHAPGGVWRGPAAGQAGEICRTADLLLNVSGVNPLRDWTASIPVRVLIDTDPLFVQVRHLKDDHARRLAQGHTAFRSFGENVPALRGVADDGFDWRPTRQPVVLDCWSGAATPAADAAFTTVMQWDSYKPVSYGGRDYGMKSLSFPTFLDLPRRTARALELAIGNPPPALAAAGWRLRDPLAVGRTPWSYRDYIWGSFAEFSVAKQGYVAARTGWFSERSANYLASRRPTLLQDTGFTDWMETGEGVVGFTTFEEAVEGARRIEADYARHAAAARDIAAAYFDHRHVLQNLLEGL
jgi:hypothetical protein